MELQSQHGTSGSLVVIQQPSLDSRQRLEYEREVQPATILSLDQIKALRSRNEYTEGPSMVRKHGPKTAPRYSKQERTHEIIPVNVNNNNEHRPLQLPHTGHVYMARAPVLSRSTSTGSAASSASTNSASSEQELLGQSPPTRHNSGYRTDRVVRMQPKASALVVDDLKSSLKVDSTQHRFICEQCGKCKCADCTAPRTLPSRLACNGQCLCSAESMVEYSTYSFANHRSGVIIISCLTTRFASGDILTSVWEEGFLKEEYKSPRPVLYVNMCKSLLLEGFWEDLQSDVEQRNLSV
ncbi:unnamed protein product [Ranitomeya imitator]|uniref:Uncharacterized protein n=1 Tax=Ranitomeya imitator TaxID=111125 RepID=A0ABN9LEC9_9NEOB|nr:unnamed protein product [Ranitomeya imitator]